MVKDMYGNQPYGSNSNVNSSRFPPPEDDHQQDSQYQNQHSNSNHHDNMSDVGSDIMTVTDLHTLSGLSNDGAGSIPTHYSIPTSARHRHRTTAAAGMDSGNEANASPNYNYTPTTYNPATTTASQQQQLPQQATPQPSPSLPMEPPVHMTSLMSSPGLPITTPAYHYNMRDTSMDESNGDGSNFGPHESEGGGGNAVGNDVVSPLSLHDVDGDTLVSGSDINTVNDDIFTVEGPPHTGGGGGGGETITTKEGSSEVYDRHAASLGQAQYYPAASQSHPPSEPGATRGSTAADQFYWESIAPRITSTTDAAAAGATAVGTAGNFWSRTFGKQQQQQPSSTMPSSEEDEDMLRRHGLQADGASPLPMPKYEHSQSSHPKLVTNISDVTPPPTMIIVGSSHDNGNRSKNGGGATATPSLPSHSISGDTDELMSVWKQRLCGLRADRLVVLLLLVLLVAVAVIVGAIVVTEQANAASGNSNSASSARSSSNGANNNNNDASTLLDRGDETVSLTRTPTTSSNAAAAPKASPPTPVTAKTSAPSMSLPEAAETAFPTVAVVTVGESDIPSIMPTATPSACEWAIDDFSVVFPVGSKDRNCTWLLTRPVEDRERQCAPGRLAFDFCRATCGNCAPLPPGQTSLPWPERCGADNTTEPFTVEDNTDGNCGFLSSAGTVPDLERLCQPGLPAFYLCRETCRNCGREVAPPQSTESDPPSTSPTVPVSVNETAVPTVTPLVNETATPTADVNTSAPAAITPAPSRITPFPSAAVAATSEPAAAVPAPEDEEEGPVEEPVEEEAPTTAQPSPTPVDNPDTPPPTDDQDDPEDPPTTGSSIEELQALFVQVSPSSSDRLDNVLSEQFRALEWIQERLSDGSFGDVSQDRIIQKWALTTFAYSIDREEQWMRNGGDDECLWDGITCGGDNGSIITAIVLDNRGIRGEFVPELSLLSALERLIVSENSMNGDIPSSFGELGNLQDFRMDRNEFSGELPDTIGGMSSLRIWYMERNVNLGGPFPESVLQMQNLEELVFYYTSIVGELPDGVCAIDTLESLILDCRQVQSDCWTQCFYRCGGDTGIPCTSG